MKALACSFCFLLTSVFLTSCEGYRCAEGMVKDKLTNLPLDSVFCDVLTGDKEMYTDTSGKFEVCNRMGGCMPNCRDIKVRFSKKGYKTREDENPQYESVIYLERE